MSAISAPKMGPLFYPDLRTRGLTSGRLRRLLLSHRKEYPKHVFPALMAGHHSCCRLYLQSDRLILLILIPGY